MTGTSVTSCPVNRKFGSIQVPLRLEPAGEESLGDIAGVGADTTKGRRGEAALPLDSDIPETLVGTRQAAALSWPSIRMQGAEIGEVAEIGTEPRCQDDRVDLFL